MEPFSDRLKKLVDELPICDRERVLTEVRNSALEFFEEENLWEALLEHVKPIIEKEKEEIDECRYDYISTHSSSGGRVIVLPDTDNLSDTDEFSNADDNVPFWMLEDFDDYDYNDEILFWVWKPTNQQIDVDASKLTWIVEAETRKLAPYRPGLRGYVNVKHKWVWQEGNGVFRKCDYVSMDYDRCTWELLCHREGPFYTKENFIKEFGRVFPGVPVLDYHEPIETLFESKADQ